MISNSTDIHCSHREPYELRMESLSLGNPPYENFSTLKLTISENENGNSHTVTVFLPASMRERLACAAAAFNAELARSNVASNYRQGLGSHNMSEPEDCPLPWTFETHELSEGFSSIIYDVNGHAVPGMMHLMEDHARLICAGVNSHAMLLAAAKEAKNTICSWHYIASPQEFRKAMWRAYQNSPQMQRLNSAIAKAEDQTK